MDLQRTHRRARKLAASERVGRYARDIAWQKYLGQLRGNWFAFVCLGLLPLVFAVFAEFMLRGTIRWLVVGAALISGPWLVAMTALVLSGSAPQMMGLQAEEWTAQELRSMRRKGWYLVSGLKPKPEFDIDHIAIGPAGLMVIEVKWSGDSWPTAQSGSKYMRQQLSKSIQQVKWNLRDTQRILGDTANGLPSFAACVLWSGDTTSEAPKESIIDGVVVISGPRLGEWLRSLEPATVTRGQIEKVWRQLSDFIQEVEDSPEQDGVIYRPTLRKLILGWTLSAVSGFVVALSAPIAVNRLTGSWVADFVGIIIVLAAGLIARRAKRWRSFGTGLLSGEVVSVMTLLIAVIRARGGK